MSAAEPAVAAPTSEVSRPPPSAPASAQGATSHSLIRQTLQPEASLTSADRAAFERVLPVFTQHCRQCHASGTRLTSDKAMQAVNMESYPFAGAPPREMGRKIWVSVGLGGKKRTMPPESWHMLTPDDLELIAEWEASLGAAKDP